MPVLTQRNVKKLFIYDEETGKLFKRFSCRKETGSWMNGYRMVGIKYKSYLVHRIIWLYNYGEFPNGDIDHIDSCRWNNRLNNLRIVSHVENAINIPKRSHNTSGITGVSFHIASNKWQAQISYKKKRISLGIFSLFKDAVIARYNAEKKYGYHKINKNTSAKQYLKKNNCGMTEIAVH